MLGYCGEMGTIAEKPMVANQSCSGSRVSYGLMSASSPAAHPDSARCVRAHNYVCAARSSECKWVIQAVHEIFEVVESDHLWDPSESEAERTSKVVFIGRRLSQAALQRGIEACVPD